jgi:hypothetical protein
MDQRTDAGREAQSGAARCKQPGSAGDDHNETGIGWPE